MKKYSLKKVVFMTQKIHWQQALCALMGRGDGVAPPQWSHPQLRGELFPKKTTTQVSGFG